MVLEELDAGAGGVVDGDLARLGGAAVDGLWRQRLVAGCLTECDARTYGLAEAGFVLRTAGRGGRGLLISRPSLVNQLPQSWFAPIEIADNGATVQ